MPFTWQTMPMDSRKIQEVDCFPTLHEVLLSMITYGWEEPDNRLLDWVTDDLKGEVVATAIFGPNLELMITCSNGRRIVAEMPEKYKD